MFLPFDYVTLSNVCFSFGTWSLLSYRILSNVFRVRLCMLLTLGMYLTSRPLWQTDCKHWLKINTLTSVLAPRHVFYIREWQRVIYVMHIRYNGKKKERRSWLLPWKNTTIKQTTVKQTTVKQKAISNGNWHTRNMVCIKPLEISIYSVYLVTL